MTESKNTINEIERHYKVEIWVSKELLDKVRQASNMENNVGDEELDNELLIESVMEEWLDTQEENNLSF